ncbi:response regulator transcription factor [Ammoniphilus sp. YIM 78166]|uniref:response regulator transcription factor n=1 Tax=Ammoniphilus sp. YIM 78166 TaxID=1644106 RepID=UPI00106FB4A2|nr:response regulator transcription factor [Ammoniphilus sp. YIM 78166]
MSTITVLMADDDPNIREFVRLYLVKQQMEMLEVDNGHSAVQLVKQNSPDFVILDIMMPELDGFDACREIRKFSDVPIIMLTAKEEEFDRVLGLELGADDYITKPFSPRELVARMKAILRRMQQKPVLEEDIQALQFGNLTIDSLRREVTIAGEVVAFRPKEFELLIHMAKSPGIVFTREQLLEQIWGYDFFGDIRTVDVHVKKIRQKLGGMDQPIIHTMWGVGYKFEVTG